MFADIASYYEALSDSESRLHREGPFLETCLRRALGNRVADIACGTGIHAAFFANLGTTVAAFDLSPDMIAHAAARRPHPAIFYAAGDMRCLSGGPWDLIVCLGNSLSLLPGFDDVFETFRAVERVLSPRGLFVVQVLNAAARAARQPRHRVERKIVGEAEIVAIKSLVPHDNRTLLSLAFFATESGSRRSVSETAFLLHLSPELLGDAATRAGFRKIEEYGGFDETAFDGDVSTDIVGVFGK